MYRIYDVFFCFLWGGCNSHGVGTRYHLLQRRACYKHLFKEGLQLQTLLPKIRAPHSEFLPATMEETPKIGALTIRRGLSVILSAAARGTLRNGTTNDIQAST